MKVLKKEENQKGITLVALVVTIIILLILAGVTLNLALGNTGLFKKAQEAADRYKSASQNESDILDELDKTLEELEGGKVADRTGLEIGDTVNYTYDDAENYELLGKYSGYGEYEQTEEGIYKLKTEKNQSIAQVKNAKWQVLNINSDGVVDLVDVSISRDGASYVSIEEFANGLNVEEANKKGGVAFGGAVGYTNGVYYLNDICAKQYSNKSLGITARNIKIEDIEKQFNETGRKAKKIFLESEKIKEYTEEKAYYPKLYKYENGSGIDSDILTTKGVEPSESKTSSLNIPMSYSGEEGYEKAISKLKIGCNVYALNATIDNYFENEKVNKILFETNSGFWIASRSAYGHTECAVFGLRNIYISMLNCYYLFHSDARCAANGLFICPIVSLGSNIELVENEDGTWNIQQ